MDLISGVVTVTSVFLIATAIVTRPLLSMSSAPGDDGDLNEPRVHRRARAAIVPLIVGLFVGLADVFVTAQLPAVAFINLIIGAAAVVIVYDVSRSRRNGSSGDTFRG